MKVTIEDISSVKKKLHIQVPPEAIAREMEKALVNAAKKAKIPGFRPGKAPKDVVKRHYEMEIQSDVMNRLISDSYLEAVQQNGLSPVEMPNITNISPFEKDAPLNFTAQVEVRPKIDLGSYEGIEIKETPVTVSDEEVMETVNRLREMYANLEVVEGQALGNEHTAIIDFEGFHEGKPIAGAKAQDHMVPLGTSSLIPGFEEQIIGMQKSETREIGVTFPQDYHNKEIAGKEAKFQVTLKEIKKKVLPELNDEFAKDIGDNSTLEELKTRVREDIEIRKKKEQASGQREDLMAKLVEAHSFDVPDGMVDRELLSMARSHAMRLARQGADLKEFDIKAFQEKNRELAVKRVKGILLLDLIADREQISVSDDEVNAALAAAASSTGQKLEAVKKYYEEQEGGLENLRLSLLHDRVLSLLLSKAKKV
jgi:trigger factor